MPKTVEAGPELDAQVAEEVMGWMRQEHKPLPLLGTGLHWRRADGTRVDRWHSQAHYGEDECYPFSTDIAADYEVLQVARLWSHKRREAFCDALREIWGERRMITGYPSLGAILYEPGDYSLAALEAVRKGKP